MNNMPPVVKNLLIINCLCFAAQWVAELYGINLTALLGLHFMAASNFMVHQFVTYMFMHGNLEHLFFNMFALWMFGRIMEAQMGSQRFLFYYLACGIGAGLVQEVAQLMHYFYLGGTLSALPYVGAQFNLWNTVGASGAVYGILLAFGVTFPEERLFIFPLPVPIRAKFFIMIYVAIELFSVVGRPGDGVAHFAHLGGMLVGYLLLRYWRRGNGGGGYYNHYTDYGRRSSSMSDFFRRFQQMVDEARKHTPFGGGVKAGDRYTQDMRYREQKKAEEDELNEILDKVRKSGYANLTEEEKRKLFERSRK